MSTKLPLYLVDDDEAILDSLGFMLGQFGYQIQTFNSGRDFLEHCALLQAGCVILDSRMPEITGQEVQQKRSKPTVRLASSFSLATAIYLWR